MIEKSGPQVADYLEKLLDVERSLRASIQARALTVVTTSSTLVTLLLAFLSIGAARNSAADLPLSMRYFLAFAVVSLVTAAVIALQVNVPARGFLNVSAQGLKEAVKSEKLWNSPPEVVIRGIALRKADTLITYRQLNDSKSQMLVYSIVIEIVGVTLTALAMIFLFLNS